ncbi:sulfatase-like hydrolase/transferase [bacterium]|nr:sulfatase-like hydrolase/transferase [bacterium]
MAGPCHNAVPRRQFLQDAAAGVAGLSLLGLGCEGQRRAQVGAGARPCNLLFIFADQMHGFALGCMNHPDVLTPHLDQLAASGTLFRNCYSAAPVCTPFRANLFTGRYGSQTGVLRNNQRIPEGARTLAAALNDGGYTTSYVGKWHLGATGNVAVPAHLRGDFQHFIGYQAYNDYEKNVIFFDEDMAPRQFPRHRTDATGDVAIERLEAIADRRFALFVSFQSPHYPEQPSPRFLDLYRDLRPTRRPNCQEIDPYIGTQEPPSRRETDPVYRIYGNNLDEYLRRYYALVTQLDDNVGRILDRLRQLGREDDTVVIFTSDHGDMQGSHGLKNKNRYYEESVRIPCIVRDPRGKRGDAREELVSSVDFFPSVLDYAGLAPEPTAEGRSVLPLTRGRGSDWEDVVISESCGAAGGDWLMVRMGRYKLVADRRLQPVVLFDLERDPYEMRDVLAQEGRRAASLRQRLVAWHEHVTRG